MIVLHEIPNKKLKTDNSSIITHSRNSIGNSNIHTSINIYATNVSNNNINAITTTTSIIATTTKITIAITTLNSNNINNNTE